MEISQNFVAFSKYMNYTLIYSEKATNFCEISTVDLSYVLMAKSMVEILQNFVAFSEYTNFISGDFIKLNFEECFK